MGTQTLWCVQWAPNSVTIDSVASIVDDLESHPITPCKRVPLGSDFQADLPNRSTSSGRVCASDCELDSLRWLGERIWPLQETHPLSFENCDLRANCRSAECSCRFKDTLECVKLHIKEKRESLKAELGEAFSLWGFDEMGETVAEKWTHEERSVFHAAVSSNPASFWHDLLKYFPAKSMAEFVSYYFNVFVLRRRAIQNRINPTNIDSDDDEMVLESDERDSDSTLESNEDEGHDAVSEDESENGSIIWLGKDSSVGKSLQGIEIVRGEFGKSSASDYEQMPLLALKDPTDNCCIRNNAEDRSQLSESFAWDAKDHENSTPVIEQSEKEAWAVPPVCSSQDELISTKGMMEEFFGSEVIEHSK